MTTFVLSLCCSQAIRGRSDSHGWVFVSAHPGGHLKVNETVGSVSRAPDSAETPAAVAPATPSGCVIGSDRSVAFSFGPYGDHISSLFGSWSSAIDADRISHQAFVEAVADGLANPKDIETRRVDLRFLGLGHQLLTVQALRPASGDERLVKVSITPERDADSEVLPLGLLLDRVPAVAFVVDDGERLVYLNNRTRELLRTDDRELIGSAPADLFEQGDLRRDILLSGNDSARIHGYHLAEVSASEAEIAILRLHKSSLNVGGREFVAAIAMDPNGAKVPHSRSADREVQLGRLVDLIPAPVWVINEKRRIVRLNEAARALPGATSSHLVGANAHSVYPETGSEVFGPADADFASIATAGRPAEIVFSPSKHRVFRVERTPLPEHGRPARVMAVMLTDLSDVHGAQQELEMQNEVLKHRNIELDQFAHMASHDLRAPLRAIYAFTQLAMEDEADQLEHLDAVLGSVDRMRSVLDSLLDYATADANPVFAEVQLAEVIESALGDLASDIAESGASVKVGPMPILPCDETSMRRLFQNLIANAVAYAGDEPPTVSISSTPDYRFVEIVVTDWGIGFPQQQEVEVFRPFKRLSAESVGQGIGLSMCRRIVESHHGTIRAISQVGGPTSIIIRLPLQRTSWQ